MPAGRPSDIDRIVGTRTIDGREQPVTVADRILSAIEAGTPIKIACAENGITSETYCEWLRVAARAQTATRATTTNPGDAPAPTLTTHQQRCIEFSAQVEASRARWAVRQNTLFEQDARQGRTKTKVVEELDPVTGAVLSRTVTTEQLPPDLASMRWRLKINFPDVYGDSLALTGADGGPVALTLEERAAALRQVAAGIRERPVDDPSTSAPEPGGSDRPSSPDLAERPVDDPEPPSGGAGTQPGGRGAPRRSATTTAPLKGRPARAKAGGTSKQAAKRVAAKRGAKKRQNQEDDDD